MIQWGRSRENLCQCRLTRFTNWRCGAGRGSRPRQRPRPVVLSLAKRDLRERLCIREGDGRPSSQVQHFAASVAGDDGPFPGRNTLLFESMDKNTPSEPLPATDHRFSPDRPVRPGDPDERVRAGLMPVMMVRPTHTVVIQLSRVPCVGEVVAMWQPDDLAEWRVVSVQHLAPVVGHSWGAVAEIHCVAVAEFDPWNGQHPTDA